MKSLIVAIIFCFLLTACNKNRVIWSPDGNRVAVLASDGLRIGDRTGVLSKPVSPTAELCSWLPDSTHAIVVMKNETRNWTELKNALSATEQLKVARIAQDIWRLRSIRKHRANPRLREAAVYLNNKFGTTAVKARLPKQFDYDSVEIFSLVQMDLGLASHPRHVLWRTTDSIDDVRISPTGTLVAVSVKEGIFYKIVIVPIKGGQVTTVVDSMADFPDWSMDGKSLFYISYPVVPESSKFKDLWDENHPWIATLNRRDVVDSNGRVLTKLSSPKVLLEVLASHSSRIRCLPDGSVLFYAQERPFPAFNKVEPQAHLFKMSPDCNSFMKVSTTRALPDESVHYFEPNQDGTRVAVPSSTGEIAVVDLSSGEVTTLEKSGEDLKFVPTWRTKDELCFPALNQHGEIEVVLQSVTDPSGRAVLSKTWPEPATEGFLIDKKEPTPKAQPKRHHKTKLQRSSNKNLIRPRD